MRIAVLSDIHSNLAALDATLASVGTVDAIWHLGDVVGYGPEPDGVVARLQEAGAIGVRGNHDAAAIGRLGVEYFNPDARRAIEWTRRTIAEPTRSWLEALPERLEVEGFTLVHGSPRDPIWEYVTSTSVARDNLDAFDTLWCLHGHTHVPVVFEADGRDVDGRRPDEGRRIALPDSRSLINPGSVGQPRDGNPWASYVLLDTIQNTMTWRRVRYEVGKTQATMRERALPDRLVQRLEIGR